MADGLLGGVGRLTDHECLLAWFSGSLWFCGSSQSILQKASESLEQMERQHAHGLTSKLLLHKVEDKPESPLGTCLNRYQLKSAAGRGGSTSGPAAPLTVSAGAADKGLWTTGLSHIPALFTALGILFTFLGLIGGLAMLDVVGGSDSQLRQQFAQLLPSVGLAFQSSFIGVALSALSLVFSRIYLADLERKRRKVELMLDTVDLDSTPRQALGRIQESLNNSLPAQFSASLEQLKPEVIQPLNKVLEELRQQRDDQFELHRQALEDVMSNTFSLMGDQLGDSLTVLRGEIDRVITWSQREREASKATMDSLSAIQKQQQEFGDQALQLVERQTESLEMFEKLVPTFNQINQRLDNVFQSMKHMDDNYEALFESSTAAAERWESVADATAKMQVRLYNDVEAAGNQLNQTLNDVLAQVHEALEDSGEQTIAGVQAVADKMHENVSTTMGGLHGDLARIIYAG
jgi:hypothetical protein